jgi:ElaB/YqjD/DUF883 family membrane-anchored ribosome-binding protein
MNTTTTPNSRVARKSLASQIDRLDTMLEGLAENLNEAVATAVRDAVHQAVREAVTAVVKEVLTNAELLRTIQGQTVAVQEFPQPSTQNNAHPGSLKKVWCSVRKQLNRVAEQTRALIGKVQARVADQLQQTKAALRERRDQIMARCRSIWQGLPGLFLLLWQLRKPLLLAMGLGSMVGLSCYFAGPLVASLASGLSSIILTLAAQALLSFRRLLTLVRVKG